LWAVNEQGAEPQQLTTFTNPTNLRPNISPDGRYIVFVSDRGGPRNLWRVDTDGSNPMRLTHGELDTSPSYTPDGRWVVYVCWAFGKSSLRKVAIDGRDPILLQSFPSSAGEPTVSLDGEMIAYLGADQKLIILPFDGGDPVKTFDLAPDGDTDVRVRWTPDGQAISYVELREGVANVWNQPLEGGIPKQVTQFKSDQIFGFDWSRDGKSLALWRGMPTRNVVLISDVK